MWQLNEHLLKASARAAERLESKMKSQILATTAWAFATIRQRDEKLFTAMVREAEHRGSESNVQMTWAFAMMGCSDEELLSASASTAQRLESKSENSGPPLR
eukprot:gnl/TRDRNA2_/TRDRNA2_174124_c10_seq4.p1 gnl/TRDRNA2_/TRDRNA2_174124_c10~~gnl/TRDRNA2_/TRDRNA2_174124_c10_seq4.p1  ORF type:complete len:102 (+),score=26.98 gnl/TRDRNA2_/TRDRNA2_174124_c10_seq4:49-354(+)